MLNSYLGITQDLLQNPAAPSSLYSTANLTTYINIARGQLAGEGECIRNEGTLVTVAGQRNYNFSAIAGFSAGVAGAIHVRRIAYGSGTGRVWVAPRSWPWFDFYHLSGEAAPVNGAPSTWAQFGQGSAGLGSITGVGGGTLSSGSFYLDPPPDKVYTLYLDCVCYPSALAADSDPEAIPYLWTDAVPFWAAWYALMTSQTTARMADAERYKQLYDSFVQRARQMANPSVDRWQYEQALDPVQNVKTAPPAARAG